MKAQEHLVILFWNILYWLSFSCPYADITSTSIVVMQIFSLLVPPQLLISVFLIPAQYCVSFLSSPAERLYQILQYKSRRYFIPPSLLTHWISNNLQRDCCLLFEEKQSKKLLDFIGVRTLFRRAQPTSHSTLYNETQPKYAGILSYIHAQSQVKVHSI
jgi:hypothetical protein